MIHLLEVLPPKRIFARTSVVLLPLLLGGCWFSPAPILNTENASLVPFAGTYADPDGSENQISITRVGDSAAYEMGQEDVTFDMFFLALDDEWYLVQMSEPMAKPEPMEAGPDLQVGENLPELAGYNLMRWSGDELLAYKAECNDDFIALPGVEETDFGCIVADLDALVAMGELYVQQVEQGTLEAEVQSLQRVAQ